MPRGTKTIYDKTFTLGHPVYYIQKKEHIAIENRIYIRGEFKESLGMNFFSPFQPEREFKVYKSCK